MASVTRGDRENINAYTLQKGWTARLRTGFANGETWNDILCLNVAFAYSTAFACTPTLGLLILNKLKGHSLPYTMARPDPEAPPERWSYAQIGHALCRVAAAVHFCHGYGIGAWHYYVGTTKPRSVMSTPSPHFSPGGPGLQTYAFTNSSLGATGSVALPTVCPIRFLAHSGFASWPIPLEP